MATHKAGNPGCCCGGGAGTHFYVGCPCTAIPDTIYAVVPAPDYSAFGYPRLRPSTLTWGAAPADCPGASSYTGYWSTETMTYTPDHGSTEVWRYLFRCAPLSGSNYYALCIVYTVDSTASPDTGPSNAFTWLVGFSGNTCTPFLLSNGTNVENTGDTMHDRIKMMTSP